MSDKLYAENRDQLGSRACSRLRQEGHIPAVMYGHGEANVNLSLRASEVQAAIRHGSKLVEVIGAVKDSALLREIQWDALGTEVLHLDLTRVSAEETVEVEVPVELRGEAPGTKEGGVVSHPMHTFVIQCPAGAIPEKIEVNINELHLGDSVVVSDIELPEGAIVLADAEAIVVQCIEATAEEEEEDAAAASLEPEVIGRKAEDEEGDSDS